MTKKELKKKGSESAEDPKAYRKQQRPWRVNLKRRLIEAVNAPIWIVALPRESVSPAIEADTMEDAYLIAAAPEMQDALKTFIAAWESEGDAFWDGLQGAVDEARAALEKAAVPK